MLFDAGMAFHIVDYFMLCQCYLKRAYFTFRVRKRQGLVQHCFALFVFKEKLSGEALLNL